MPELPEVETIARRLRQVLPGKKIVEFTQLHPKSFEGETNQVLDTTIIAVTRKSKLLGFELDSGNVLMTHLKMTGQLLYTDGQKRIGGGHPSSDWVTQLPSSHTRLSFKFQDASQLFFNDQRLFGWMRVMTPNQVAQEYAKLGPDVIDIQFTVEYFTQQLSKRSIAIKTAIMTNQIVAGVGNIYACDALNLARIDPYRPAKSLAKSEIISLHQALLEIIGKGIELGGTTFDGKYVDIDGLAGGYQQVARVYGRQDLPCLHCKTPILKSKLAGRGTYYCRKCQH